MSYCINPSCPNPQNLDEASVCQSCGSTLLLDGRYRATRPLAQRGSSAHAILVQVFEATDTEGTPKVLKVLYDNDLVEVSRFRREAEVLSHLSQDCRGLSKIESDGYFTCRLSPNKGAKQVHCLIMERIKGTNLHKWVQQQGQIDEKQALDWLRQLTVILEQVHQRGFFHRDIKPANIMRRRKSGKLVLIDFGAVRETTDTYEVRFGKGEVTRVYSMGYTALEQLQGRAVPQSDFFSIGRTFVYLLTGEEPRDLPLPQDNKLTWRDRARVSQQVADLIDQLMAPLPEDRPQDTQTVLQRLDAIESIVAAEDAAGLTLEASSPQLNSTRPAKRWPQLVGGLTVGAVLLLTVFALWTRQWPKHQPLCLFTDVPNVPTGLFNYGGSTSWAPIRTQVDAAIEAARPEFRLRYIQSGGSTEGIHLVLEGQLAFSQSSRPPLEQEYQQAQLRGFSLESKQAGIDAIAVAVNPRLNVSGLTFSQLKAIYTGKVRNWQQIGGPNLAITPYSRSAAVSGTVQFFISKVLAAEPLSNRVILVSSTTDGLRQTATVPGGIYYASAPEVVPQCTVRPLPLGISGKFIPPYQEPFVPLQFCPSQKNRLNLKAFEQGQYPLTRNLFVIVKNFKGEENTQEQAGKAYANLLLTHEGQKLIEQAGFVAVGSSNMACPNR